MKAKTFDCVEMKRIASQKIYNTVKDMTIEQELGYWRDSTIKLRAKIDDQKCNAEKRTLHTA